jgi:hypothetical protein
MTAAYLMAADSTVTIGVAFLLNLLAIAYAFGKSQQKNSGEIEKMKSDQQTFADGFKREVNGVGRKTGKIILFLSETADGPKRQRLTDILKDQ